MTKMCPTCKNEMVTFAGIVSIRSNGAITFQASQEMNFFYCPDCDLASFSEFDVVNHSVLPLESVSLKQSGPSLDSKSSVPSSAAAALLSTGSTRIESIEQKASTNKHNICPPLFALDEFLTKGHLISDSFLDILEQSKEPIASWFCKHLISDSRKLRRHLDHYVPTSKIIVHDTIIDPTICELLKTDEVRFGKRDITKHYYFRSPEGLFFKISHNQYEKDTVTELPLSAIKKMFRDDLDTYTRIVPDCYYKTGMDPNNLPVPESQKPPQQKRKRKTKDEHTDPSSESTSADTQAAAKPTCDIVSENGDVTGAPAADNSKGDCTDPKPKDDKKAAASSDASSADSSDKEVNNEKPRKKKKPKGAPAADKEEKKEDASTGRKKKKKGSEAISADKKENEAPAYSVRESENGRREEAQIKNAPSENKEDEDTDESDPNHIPVEDDDVPSDASL